MSSFREIGFDFNRLPDGKEVYATLPARIGQELDPLYEALDTPYTIYSIFEGANQIAYVHGVNVPGSGGTIQVFVAVNLSGQLTKVFFQRFESPAAAVLKEKSFRARFEGLDLSDFYKNLYYQTQQVGSGRDKVGAIQPSALPSIGESDFRAVLKGLRKNLVILDLAVFNRKFEPFFAQLQKQRALPASGAKP
ncbi:MAG: hypothetical protein AAB425_07745 [Bdellovibrionota bacterium]